MSSIALIFEETQENDQHLRKIHIGYEIPYNERQKIIARVLAMCFSPDYAFSDPPLLEDFLGSVSCVHHGDFWFHFSKLMKLWDANNNFSDCIEVVVDLSKLITEEGVGSEYMTLREVAKTNLEKWGFKTIEGTKDV